jgi:hypothetical protein
VNKPTPQYKSIALAPRSFAITSVTRDPDLIVNLKERFAIELVRFCFDLP